MKKLLLLVFVLLTAFFNTDMSVKAESTTSYSYSYLNEYDSFKNVVIFIKFNDEVFYNAPYEFEYYKGLFNGEDMVSLRDYYLEVSYNQLTIDSIFTHSNEIVYYQDSHDRSYYKPYDASMNPNGYKSDSEQELREHTLLKNAIDWVDDNNLISDSVNLDVNNDGDIDSITFMISGEDTGWNELLWPHKWELYTYYNGGYTYDAPQINGKYAWDYTLELLGNTAHYDYAVDVAILAHETFHLISAPDLYHYYDYDWIDPISEWGLMGSVDVIPSHMLMYMKYQYGNWINDASSITSSGSYTLYSASSGASNYYKIPLGYGNESIYLEYRERSGDYEITLPQSGLLVYRVDTDFVDDGNVDGYYYNNRAAEEVWLYRPLMDDMFFPIEFDETDPGYDVDGDLYYAALSDSNRYDEIGVGTDILLFDGQGNEIEIKIDNIIEHDGYITFDVTFDAVALPEIELKGYEEVTLEYGDEYEEAGYNVTVLGYEDDVEVTGSVNPYVLGEYILTYTIYANNGEVLTQTTRTVTVEDNTNPTATLLPSVDTISIGEEWVDYGVEVHDNYDESPTISIKNNINNQEVGTYEVLYTVTDDFNNKTTVKRYVTVVEENYQKQNMSCAKAITTYEINDEINFQVCTYMNEKMTVVNEDEINTFTPGTKEVIYQVEINDVTYTFKTYIFVVEDYEVVLYIDEERRRKL